MRPSVLLRYSFPVNRTAYLTAGPGSCFLPACRQLAFLCIRRLRAMAAGSPPAGRQAAGGPERGRTAHCANDLLPSE